MPVASDKSQATRDRHAVWPNAKARSGSGLLSRTARGSPVCLRTGANDVRCSATLKVAITLPRDVAFRGRFTPLSRSPMARTTLGASSRRSMTATLCGNVESSHQAPRDVAFRGRFTPLSRSPLARSIPGASSRRSVTATLCGVDSRLRGMTVLLWGE
jgi:hypothetical protein